MSLKNSGHHHGHHHCHHHHGHHHQPVTASSPSHSSSLLSGFSSISTSSAATTIDTNTTIFSGDGLPTTAVAEEDLSVTSGMLDSASGIIAAATGAAIAEAGVGTGVIIDVDAATTASNTDSTVPSSSSIAAGSSEVEMMTSTSADTDLIEEVKEVFPDIKVRAAKLPKLIEILIDSFGKNLFIACGLDSTFFIIIHLFDFIKDENGKVLPNTDFPRVFILMHKWFMESIVLSDMLYDLYENNKDHQAQHPIDYRLRICHVLK